MLSHVEPIRSFWKWFMWQIMNLRTKRYWAFAVVSFFLFLSWKYKMSQDESVSWRRTTRSLRFSSASDDEKWWIDKAPVDDVMGHHARDSSLSHGDPAHPVGEPWSCRRCKECLVNAFENLLWCVYLKVILLLECVINSRVNSEWKVTKVTVIRYLSS